MVSNGFDTDDMLETLVKWLAIQHPLESMGFLSKHPELLTPLCGAIIDHVLHSIQTQPGFARVLFGPEEATSEEEIQESLKLLHLLRDIHRRGRTQQAIRDAYFDVYGGVTLDLSPRLQMAMLSLMGVAMLGESKQAFQQGSQMLRRIVGQFKDDPTAPPEMLAELRFLLEDALRQSATAEALSVQQERLACLQTVLPVYTRSRYPRHYADVQHHLGLVYKHLKEGDKQDNLDEAIACFKRALEVYNAEEYPEDHAMNRNNLGDVLVIAYMECPGQEQQHFLDEAVVCFNDALKYYTRRNFPIEYATVIQRLGGAHAAYKEGPPYTHLEQARYCFQQALEVFTLARYPMQYAQTHHWLALLYKERTEYDRPEAIQSCENALRVYTLNNHPRDYAALQNLLGSLSLRRFSGRRADNVEAAIAYHTRALQVYTRENDPIEQAETQNLLGNAYRERLLGTQQENLEMALTFYQRALKVFRDHHHERGIAKIYYNLAGTYSSRLQGSRTENIEQALEHCQRALEMYTRARFPDDYAQAMALLGSLYRERLSGERRKNLEEAIACFNQALEIYTPARSPKNYAEVQHNLGNAYADRIEGSRQENLEAAIKCYTRALNVFTATDFPLQHAKTSSQFGTVYSERIAGERRANQEEALRYFEQALQILTNESAPLDYAQTHVNLANLFRNRITGTRQENQEQAIEHYHRALSIVTLTTFPVEYAIVQDSLGTLYSQRIAGERRANLEEAIACHIRALQVFTRAASPLEYAFTLLNLGTAYTFRLIEERQDNLQQAVSYYKAALEIITPENAPTEYANAQSNLGSVYLVLATEEQRYRIELALECFEKALNGITLHNNPMLYAALQGNLGYAYSERVMGKRWENIEKAITSYKEALNVFTLEATPLDYGKAQNNLGAVYMERLTGERRANIEQAITCFEQALTAYASDPTSWLYADTLTNLGTAYAYRREGDRRENLEQALAYHRQSLALCDPKVFPQEYASAELHLGNAYARRLAGDHQANQQAAIACYRRALTIFTLEAFPKQHRDAQQNLAIVEAAQQHWQEAHTAYEAAMKAEEQLFTLGTGIIGKDVILKAGKEAALDNGYALTRLGHIAQAAISIERGRARELAEAMALNAFDPHWIRNPELRERYQQAQKDFVGMQAILNTMASRHFDIDRMLPNQWSGNDEQHNRRIDIIFTEALRERRLRFEQVLTEIGHTENTPLYTLITQVNEQTLLRAADACGVGHAIIYLAATSWGGIAIAALSSDLVEDETNRFTLLDLPELTKDVIDDLLEQHLDSKGHPVSNSFAAAQAQQGLQIFLHDWQGETFRKRAMALRHACEAGAETSTFDLAAQQTLQAPWVAEMVDQPLVELQASSFELLARTIAHFLMHYELQRSLEVLAPVALRPLATWLQQQGVSSCTLIPCGALTAFPLHAAEIMPGQTMADLFMVSIAPNARVLLTAREHPAGLQERDVAPRRKGVYALGNPLPTHHNLAWGVTEALTISKIARSQNLTAKSKTGRDATREWLIDAVEHGYVVDASCHGHFDASSPLDSSLRLAQLSYIPLYELLSHQIEMRGLRLLILSACQTAVLDLRGTVNEVHSLAVGMVQAGAGVVLAALWPIDEIATYLLIVRFAQEWFPRIKEEPPAAALARAQRWLRTVTIQELQTWSALRKAEAIPEQRDEVERQVSEQRTAFEDFFTHFGGELRSETSYDIDTAQTLIHTLTRGRTDRTARPFAHAIYWAGFQILGW